MAALQIDMQRYYQQCSFTLQTSTLLLVLEMQYSESSLYTIKILQYKACDRLNQPSGTRRFPHLDRDFPLQEWSIRNHFHDLPSHLPLHTSTSYLS